MLGVSQGIFIPKKTARVGIYAEADVESTWYPQIGDPDFPTPVGTGAIGAKNLHTGLTKSREIT